MTRRVRKISDQQVEQLLERYAAGDLVKDIAADLGVTSSAVSQWVMKSRPRRRAKCGTYGAWQRHKRQGEPVDRRCAAAKRRRDKERRTR